jgi:hypothetical protein
LEISGSDGRSDGISAGATVDWSHLHALQAEVALRAATVSELEAEAAAANRYADIELLDRADKQTELSNAYIHSIKAKLALHAAIPDLQTPGGATLAPPVAAGF